MGEATNPSGPENSTEKSLKLELGKKIYGIGTELHQKALQRIGIEEVPADVAAQVNLRTINRKEPRLVTAILSNFPTFSSDTNTDLGITVTESEHDTEFRKERIFDADGITWYSGDPAHNVRPYQVELEVRELALMVDMLEYIRRSDYKIEANLIGFQNTLQASFS